MESASQRDERAAGAVGRRKKAPSRHSQAAPASRVAPRGAGQGPRDQAWQHSWQHSWQHGDQGTGAAAKAQRPRRASGPLLKKRFLTHRTRSAHKTGPVMEPDSAATPAPQDLLAGGHCLESYACHA